MKKIMLTLFMATVSLSSFAQSESVDVFIDGVTYTCPVQQAFIFKDGTLVIDFERDAQETMAGTDGSTVCKKKE